MLLVILHKRPERVIDIKVVAFVLLVCIIAGCAQAASTEFEMKNAGISRTVSFLGKFLKTTKIEASGVQMLEQPSVEFLSELEHKGEVVVLMPSDFVIKKIDEFKNDREMQTSVELHCVREGFPLEVYIDYFRLPAAFYQQKSIKVRPCKSLPNTLLTRIVIEDMRFKSAFVPVAPIDRYAGKSGDVPEADLSDLKTRFSFNGPSNFAAIDPKSQRGVFFFVSSLFGQERFSPRSDLTMSESMRVALSEGYVTGRATIGVAVGPPETLYKRLREFLWDNYCVMRGKGMLVGYETWMNEQQDVSEAKCLTAMKAMQQEGYFNAFHLGYGWENHYPLTEDKEKFPGGLAQLAQQAKSMGLGMVYWINPLGSNGQTTDSPRWGGMWDGLIKDHPDWFVTYDPEKNPTPKGDDILCFTSPYADYVEEKLLRLVTDCGAAMLYIDGNDWNIFKCPPSGPYSVDYKSLPYVVLNRYRSIYEKLRKANPNLVICLSSQAVNTPLHAHRLNTIDQIEFWNGVAGGCLADRQQRYNQAFIFPPYTMNSGWNMADMTLPMPELKYVIISTISGYPQIQGTQQIKTPSAELSAYLKKFYAFRAKFDQYFQVYQHVLDFPDGVNVDGEGHIIGNKGFILLFNPSREQRKVALPLDELGLELRGELKLSDWTELDSPIDMGSARAGDRVEIDMDPVSAKIIGINISQ